MGCSDPASTIHEVRVDSLARSGRPSPEEAIHSNDIRMDQDGRLYLIDRWGAGMHILEYTG
jgi:hypothetical protein